MKWWSIIKSDVDFKLNMPKDGPLGFWNPKNNIVTVNLNAIRYHIQKNNPKMTITERHLITSITDTVNHESLHEALDVNIKEIIKNLVKDNFTSNKGEVPLYILTHMGEEIYDELLHEWAVRLLEGKTTDKIIIELTPYVVNSTNKIREEMEKIRHKVSERIFEQHKQIYNTIILNMVEFFNKSIEHFNDKIHRKLKRVAENIEGSDELVKGLKLDNKTLTGFEIEDINEERPEVEDNNCIEELRGIAERVENSTNIFHVGYQTDNWSIIEDIPEEVACEALKMIKAYDYDGLKEIKHTLGEYSFTLKHIGHSHTHIFMITIRHKSKSFTQPVWKLRGHPGIMYAIVKSIHRRRSVDVAEENQIDMAKYVDWR